MQRIQADTFNGNAATLTPYLLRVGVDGRTRPAQDLLRDWNYRQPTDSAPAAYFNAVWRNLLRLMFGGTLSTIPGAEQPDGGDRWFEAVRHLLTTPDDPWWRNRGERLNGRDQLLRAAMRDGAAELSRRLGTDPHRWQWGALHQLTLANPTLGVGGPWLVKRLLNRGPYPMAGGSAVVDANGWDAAAGYQVDWAPSMRLVVDLSSLDSSRWVNQTGASGHAFNDHYTDQVALWRNGSTTPWPFSDTAVAAASRHRLTLRP
jgi:penicillin G amidase